MFRVTSLTEMPEAQLNRLIRRVGLLLFVGLIAFVGFYAIDRFRAPSASIPDRETTALEEAVRVDPADITSRGRLADVYVADQRYDEAVALYTEILQTGKEQRNAYFGRGRALEFKGDLAGAAADYQEVVDLSTGGEMAAVDAVLAKAYYGLGSILLKQDKPQDAVASLEKSLKIARTDADTMNLLGSAYVMAGTPEKAIEPLEKAILFVPVGWADPYDALAQAYAATAKPEKAEWAAAMAQAQRGDTAGATNRLEAIVDGAAGIDAMTSLGLLAEQSGDTAAAGDWYRRALAKDPDARSAQLGLSRVAGTSVGHPSMSAAPSAEGSN